MPCLCGTNGGTFLSCLRRVLGVTPAAGWSPEAHTALYAALAPIINVQGDRGQTPDQIRAVVFGSEASITAAYVGNYPTRFLPSNNDFWRCAGVTRDDAATQAASGSGPYYEAMLAVMDHVRRSEMGEQPKDAGTPWWLWLLGGVAAGGAVYLLVRD
jgi:hypothetical protein